MPFLLRNKREIAAAFIAVLIVVLKTAYFLHYGYNIADESYAWYGMQRILHGEVPQRDFLAYDPGRYYWGALFMALAHSDGIVVFRIANAAFEAIGLSIALILLSRYITKKDWLFYSLGALVISLWFIPSFKSYDQTCCFALIASIAYLIERPTLTRYFVLGTVLGLVAIIGRNHAAYGLAATGLAIIYINLRDRPVPIGKAFLAWLCGCIVGYFPVIAMMIFIKGFAAASMYAVHIVIESGTNLPLPVPWPWKAEAPAASTLLYKLHVHLIGYFFVAMLGFGAAALLYTFRRKWKGSGVSPALAACSFLALPYAHYAFSRADVSHLAFGGMPLFLGLLIASRRFWWLARTGFVVVLLGMSIALVYYQFPTWNATFTERIGGADLQVNPLVHEDVQLLRKLVARLAPDGEPFVVTPVWPGAYTLFDRKSPMWDIYALQPRDIELQEEEIAQIDAAKPAFVVVVDQPPESNALMLLRFTNPRIAAYIRSNYRETQAFEHTFNVHVYLPKHW